MNSPYIYGPHSSPYKIFQSRAGKPAAVRWKDGAKFPALAFGGVGDRFRI
jgi:hypothetical protein